MHTTNRIARIAAALTLIALGAAGHANAGTFRVSAVLKAPDLSSHHRAIVRQEVDRIWAPYGISVQWHDRLPEFGEIPDLAVTVVLDDSHMVSRSRREHPVLGEVVMVGDLMLRHIAVSPRGTREVVNSVVSSYQNPARFAVIHARFVGRVVAHELGHLLLKSRQHADTGLMRPFFGWRDAVKDDARDFRLEPRDMALLQQSQPALTVAATSGGGVR